MTRFRLTAGSPARLGAHFDGEGTNFAVFSENATKLDLCLFSEDGGRETSCLALPEQTGPVWHGFVPGLRPGARYGFRAHGPYAPDQGHRFNPNKLLLDPYAREISGSWRHGDAVLGYDPNAPDTDLSFSTTDSAPFVPKSVVSHPAQPASDNRPNTHWQDTLIYEAHPRGLTMRHSGIAPGIRGTFDALAADPMLDHLHGLGVTAIELLPVHAFLDEVFLRDLGLTNYWGYNTIGFFTPEPRYFGPAGLQGFRDMVRRFHTAGIEVILDVVYNHTAEGDHLGPTLSFRGLDNAAYYRLNPDQPRYHVNDTGCGNTLDVSHPYVLRMVLDSLRFWAGEMGVDGFRFDLATTLAREYHGFDPNGGFLDALRQDPLLSTVKLIAEPWDVGPGGYRLGEFPAPFAEWNDTFRDSARKFWRGDAHSGRDLAARLLGSADRFDRGGRRAWSSVNFVAAHDGFTLADLTSYDHTHNEANGEANHDGHQANFSANCGAEGPTNDPDVLSRRARRQRNLLATLFLSQGAPMLLAGDETGNSQGGNNNAYCQDNPTTWLDWENANDALLAFVRRLAVFRRAHPSLRQPGFLHGAAVPGDGRPDVEWRNPDGGPPVWDDPGHACLCLLVRMAVEMPDCEGGDDTVFMVLNGADGDTAVSLPELSGTRVWLRALDTAAVGDAAAEKVFGVQQIAGRSVAVFTPVGSGENP